MNFSRNSHILFLIAFVNFTSAQTFTPAQIDEKIKYNFLLANREKALELSSETYTMAENIGYYNGKAKSLTAKINCYLGLGEQDKALENANQLYNLAKREKDYYHCIQALIAKTIAYSYLGFFEKVTKILEEAKSLSNKIENEDDYNSSMGQIYAAKSEILNLQYDTPQNTIKNDLLSVSYYKKIKDKGKRNEWLSIQYSSLGYSYIDLEDYKTSLYYSRKAYELSKIEKDSINQAFGLYGIANAYMKMNQIDSSIYYYKKAFPLFEKANDIYRLQYIYDDLATLYENSGDDIIYSYYSKKAKEISDIIRKKEKTETEKISNIILQQEKEEWSQNFYISIAILVFLSVVSLILTLIFFIKYKSQKHINETNKVNLTDAEEELNHLELKVNDAFNELIELAKNNDSSFLSRFREVYPQFYSNLTNSYPDLTTGQIQFCALLKLNFTTKEIAAYSYISVRSVETKKNRLRKRLEIPSEIDLNKWMMDL